MPDQRLRDERDPTNGAFGGPGHLPGDFGHVGRDAAIDLALEVFEDLGTPLSPLLRGGDLRPILHLERIGHGWHPVISGRFFEARAGLGTAALAGAKRLDAKLIHHVLMVVIACLDPCGGRSSPAATETTHAATAKAAHASAAGRRTARGCRISLRLGDTLRDRDCQRRCEE